MSRPRKNTPEGELASEKYRETMLKKYGGKEGVKKHYIEVGKLGGQSSILGGFACQKVDKNGMTGSERAKYWGRKGGKISSRLKDKPSLEFRRELYKKQQEGIKDVF